MSRKYYNAYSDINGKTVNMYAVTFTLSCSSFARRLEGLVRLVSSIEVAERISIHFGPLMRLALGSGWHVSPGKFDTIEQNNSSAVILCF